MTQHSRVLLARTAQAMTGGEKGHTCACPDTAPGMPSRIRGLHTHPTNTMVVFALPVPGGVVICRIIPCQDCRTRSARLDCQAGLLCKAPALITTFRDRATLVRTAATHSGRA